MPCGGESRRRRDDEVVQQGSDSLLVDKGGAGTIYGSSDDRNLGRCVLADVEEGACSRGLCRG